MKEDAHVRIQEHRLMRTAETPLHEEHAKQHATRIAEYARIQRTRFVRRIVVQVVVFVFSYIFTAGVGLLGILLWVRPDGLLALVLVALVSACVFVASFASIRMLILHTLLNEYPNKEEDPGMRYHLGKSVTYGFVALVFALVLTGLLVTIASRVT